MKMGNLFGNVNMGPVKNAHLSHLGVAVRNANGEMVSYDRANGEIVNVDLIDMDASGMVFAIPVAIKDIAAGDVILHTNGNMVFVTDVAEGIKVVDVAQGEKKEILPTRSMFGFNFVTKIVSMIDFSSTSANEDNPFGNMLPLMMLSGGSGNMKDMLLPMMLMGGDMGSLFGGSVKEGGKGTGLDFSNPLMMMMLMGGDKAPF